MAVPKVDPGRTGEQEARQGPDSAPAAPSQVTLADASHAEAPSPARALQALLSHNLEADAQRRWSPRQTLLFVLAVCGGFWAAVGAVLRLLLK